MKILHISTHDIRGGAARAAHRLHRGLLAIGQDSTMYIQKRDSGEPEILEYIPKTSLPARLGRVLRERRNFQQLMAYTRRPQGLEPFSFDRAPSGREMTLQMQECDVVNLHWVAGFLDYPSFFSFWSSIKKPLVWTLHDLNPMTGGCHYDGGCGKYLHGCNACPQLGSSDPHDLASHIFASKASSLRLLDAEKTRIVGPSHWIAGAAKNSKLLNRFPASVIPYGLDIETYAPRDRAQCRYVLGIPPDARVVLFVADDIRNKRKGFAMAKEVISRLKDVLICTIGRGQPTAPPGVKQLHFGQVTSDRVMSVFYSAADVFLITSMQDNLPNTVMEAMACGVPVAGFDVGGIRDMVRHGETGFLVPPEDIEGLALHVTKIIDDSQLKTRMRDASRAIAETQYTLTTQAKRYEELYKQLL